MDKIDLASRSNSIDITIPSEKKGEVFCGYREALTQAKKGLAYVSLPNSLHAEWVEVALQEGFHVVVDKPAFINTEDTLRLRALARSKGLCLSEATVWPFQSQILLAQEQIKSNNSDIKLIQATFSFPPFDHNNFRNSKVLGGGAFNDLGIYALTPGRVFLIDIHTKLSFDHLQYVRDIKLTLHLIFQHCILEVVFFRVFLALKPNIKTA